MWWWLVLGLILGGFGWASLRGAPYLPILSKEVEGLLDLADLKPGQLLLDLGCGDGRLLKAAAKRGIRGIGYEINPWLYAASIINCLSCRGLVEIRFGDYWLTKLPPADGIYVFLIGHFMAKLDRKLTREIEKPTKLISFVFALSDRRPVKRTRNAAVYMYP